MTAESTSARSAGTRRVFVGISVVVSRLHEAATQCDVMPSIWDGQKPDYEHLHLHIDMDDAIKLPDTGSSVVYEDAKFDAVGIRRNGVDPMAPGDPPTDGIIATSIGPDWPTGVFKGALYISMDEYLHRRGTIEHHGASWPPRSKAGEAPSRSQDMAAQFVHVRYSNSERFIGFAANFISANSEQCELAIWNPRREQYWKTTVKFAAIDESVDEGVLAGLQNKIAPVVKSGLTLPAGTAVSVFIKDTVAATMVYSGNAVLDGLASPKLPFWMGIPGKE